MVTKVRACLAQCNHLGVSRWIPLAHIPVPAAPYNAVIADHHRADGNLADLKRSLCCPEGFLHPEFVGLQEPPFRALNLAESIVKGCA